MIKLLEGIGSAIDFALMTQAFILVYALFHNLGIYAVVFAAIAALLMRLFLIADGRVIEWQLGSFERERIKQRLKRTHDLCIGLGLTEDEYSSWGKYYFY